MITVAQNTDPATRYEITLACGHTKTQTYPPMGSMAKIVCMECPDPNDHMRPWRSYLDTLRDIVVLPRPIA